MHLHSWRVKTDAELKLTGCAEVKGQVCRTKVLLKATAEPELKMQHRRLWQKLRLR